MTDLKLLSDAQMQQFLAHGYLCLKTELPPSFHDAIYARFDEIIGQDAPISPGNNLLPYVPDLTAVFEDANVKGALTSVLGKDYVMHPHRALHNNMPGTDAQTTHKDSYWGYTRRVRNHRPRWVMIMYVPQETPVERGPTGVIPGSQYQLQNPDQTIMPEVPGALEKGGFLLIHYDVWHHKMKNFTDLKRFMMKFEFIRMQPPAEPSWDHQDKSWTLQSLPGIDLTPVWQRQWSWLSGARLPDDDLSEAAVSDALANISNTDRSRRLEGVNMLARDPKAVAAHLDILGGLLSDPFEPVAIDAAYGMARVGADAIPALAQAMRDGDGVEPNVNRSSERGEAAAAGQVTRSASYGMVEIGKAAIPALLDLLQGGQQRVRTHACFALGEIEVADTAVMDALVEATQDAEPRVRINAVEALGLKPGTPASIQALTAALKDEDDQMRFSAAFSLAQLGPVAQPAVPALKMALSDTNRYVPGYAVEALERIGTPDALATLVPYLKTARWCPKTTPASTY